VLSVSQNKDAYISEFGSLKTEYEGVIQRLEDSLIDYQKRNWNLEQENKELNEQLEQLRELLQEVKAINSLQPARKEYRKLAEMEVIASRPLPKQEPPPVQQQPISEAA
jgi:DNA repair exonuclease SbcCD ATPase subunit